MANRKHKSEDLRSVEHTARWDFIFHGKKIPVVLTISALSIVGTAVAATVLVHILHTTKDQAEADEFGKSLKNALEESGVDVEILEAQNRIGNEIWFLGWRAHLRATITRTRRFGTAIDKLTRSVQAALNHLPFQRSD